MNPLFKKPKDMRFVDMAMWIDNNFYSEDCDMDKAFTYMYLLAYMLGSKSRYFKSIDDYDGYACFLALSTYQRMTDKEKPRVKSVLNYMKSIQYFRKNAYERESYSQIIDPIYNQGWNEDSYVERSVSEIESNNHTMIEESIQDCFREIPHIIRNNIPSIYKSDKVLYRNLYISSLLSLLDKFTLPKVREEYLENKKQTVSFNESNYYRKHIGGDIILWHIPESMTDVVKIIINKTNTNIISEIQSIIGDSKLTYSEFSILSKSSMWDNIQTGDHDEA